MGSRPGKPPARRARTAHDPELPDVLRFMQVLWALVHALDRVSKHMARDIGVTGPQRLVLRVVGLSPGIAAGELAAILHVHPSTLTGVLGRLTRQRLLARTADPEDRRRAILHLTARGRRVNALARGTVESIVRDALRRVTPGEGETTRRVLAVIGERLDQMAGEAQRPGRRRPG